jgi:hypothetical protein
MLQPGIGNQPMLRLPAKRDTNLTENDSPARLVECGLVPMISGWSHAMWVPSQIMRADMRPVSVNLGRNPPASRAEAPMILVRYS